MAKPKLRLDERALRKVADQGARRLAGRLNRMLAGMVEEFAGRPVDEVKPVLASRWEEASGGGSITDPELTQFAEEIAVGRQPEVRT